MPVVKTKRNTPQAVVVVVTVVVVAAALMSKKIAVVLAKDLEADLERETGIDLIGEEVNPEKE